MLGRSGRVKMSREVMALTVIRRRKMVPETKNEEREMGRQVEETDSRYLVISIPSPTVSSSSARGPPFLIDSNYL